MHTHTYVGEGNGNPLQYSCLEIPWIEEPGGLQSTRLQRIRHDWVTQSIHTYIYMHTYIHTYYIYTHTQSIYTHNTYMCVYIYIYIFSPLWLCHTACGVLFPWPTPSISEGGFLTTSPPGKSSLFVHFKCHYNIWRTIISKKGRGGGYYPLKINLPIYQIWFTCCMKWILSIF